jgi:DNA-binding MarR family transcriptional regulator
MQSDGSLSALSTLAAALRPFRELGSALNTTMPISVVLTFLLVPRKEGQTVSELAKAAGISLAKMSRQLADLSEANRYGAAGLGLIEQRIYDRRFQRSRLTEKGRALVRQIANAVQERSPSAPGAPAASALRPPRDGAAPGSPSRRVLPRGRFPAVTRVVLHGCEPGRDGSCLRSRTSPTCPLGRRSRPPGANWIHEIKHDG